MVPAALEANAAFVFLKKLQDFYAGQLAHGLAINLVQEITWSDWVREVFLDFWLHLTNHRRGRPSNGFKRGNSGAAIRQSAKEALKSGPKEDDEFPEGQNWIVGILNTSLELPEQT